MRGWTKEEEALLEDYSTGKRTSDEIALLVGKSKGAVRSRAHKLGKTKNIWNQFISEKIQQDVVESYVSGLTMAAVQQQFQLTYHQVRWCLKTAGKTVDRHRASVEATKDQLRILTPEECQLFQIRWKEGVSILQIATEIGCCKQVLGKHIKAFDLIRDASTLRGSIAQQVWVEGEELTQLVSDTVNTTLNQAALSKKFRLCKAILRRSLQKAGVDTAIHGRRKAAIAVRLGYLNGTRKISPRAGAGIKTLATTPFQGDLLMRSRTEARWASELNSQGWAWFYEVRGYPLKDGKNYLPDFWITQETVDQARIVLGDTPSAQCIRQYLQQVPCRLEDVKGWWDSQHPSFLKIQAFLQEYPRIPFNLRIENRKTKGWTLWP